MRWSWGRRDARRTLECLSGAGGEEGTAANTGGKGLDFAGSGWEDSFSESLEPS